MNRSDAPKSGDSRLPSDTPDDGIRLTGSEEKCRWRSKPNAPNERGRRRRTRTNPAQSFAEGWRPPRSAQRRTTESARERLVGFSHMGWWTTAEDPPSPIDMGPG